MLIATNPQTTDKGWWLIQQIKKIDEVNKAEDWQLSLWFGKYKIFDFPVKDKVQWTEREWKQAIKCLQSEFLLVWSNRSESINQETYNRLQRRVMKIPGIGSLSANHVIAIASIVGIQLNAPCAEALLLLVFGFDPQIAREKAFSFAFVSFIFKYKLRYQLLCIPYLSRNFKAVQPIKLNPLFSLTMFFEGNRYHQSTSKFVSLIWHLIDR